VLKVSFGSFWLPGMSQYVFLWLVPFRIHSSSEQSAFSVAGFPVLATVNSLLSGYCGERCSLKT